jgi:hypothetical protein
MKINFTLLFALSVFTLSLSQTDIKKTEKRSAMEAPIKYESTNVEIDMRAVECIWESDFSNAGDWDTDHDPADCALDWQIGQNLECAGSYPITAIESANGYYAMLDSDAYGGEEGGTEVEDSWLTMSSPVDCSGLDNVIVEFDTWYRSYNSERCFLVVSTDGTFPTDLSPTTEADPANGIYEIFPDVSNDVGADLGDNPSTRRINISESAGGQPQVWIRFNWTGTWGYAWFIDRVCVAEQPADDIELSYGLVSHNGTGEEYGRVPLNQLGDGAYTGGGAFNFGVNDANDVSLTMDVSNSAGENVTSQTNYTMYGYELDAVAGGLVLNMDAPIYGPVATNTNVYFEDMTPMSGVSEDIYTATFTLSSSGDTESGDNFGNNTATRDFELTNGLYSTDGIGVHSDPTITRMGTGSFTDATDGFMMMSYYDISQSTQLGGVWIGLDSYAYTEPLTVPGGELVVALRDTTLLSAETFDPGNVIASSDFYLITQQDIDNGYVVVPFGSNISLNPNAYFISVEMYSNGNATDIYILDDETVPQPSYLSMIYIPGDQVYTNGTATAIRMITDGAISDIISLEENNLEYNIFPNPSSGTINIELGEQGEFSVEISDIIGKSIYNNIIKTNTNIDINGLDTGVYFVTISNENKSNTTKLIVE